jgi:hypothetical protein
VILPAVVAAADTIPPARPSGQLRDHFRRRVHAFASKQGLPYGRSPAEPSSHRLSFNMIRRYLRQSDQILSLDFVCPGFIAVAQCAFFRSGVTGNKRPSRQTSEKGAVRYGFLLFHRRRFARRHGRRSQIFFSGRRHLANG